MVAQAIPTKYVKKLDINGLSGRIMQLPKPSKNSRNLLLVYGLGSSLERVYPIAKTFGKQSGVIVPDLPGFGGMDSMFKIGMRPTLNNLTDYIATIIKFHFPRQRFVLAGLDYGFAIVNNLLEKYPELRDRVDMVVSLAGVNDWHELQMPKPRLHGHRLMSTVLTRQLPGGVAQGVALAVRPRLRHITPDLRTYLHARHSLLHLKPKPNKLKLTVHYFPGNDCVPVDQTVVLENLKNLYKKALVVTDFELECTKGDVSLRPLRRRRKLTWLNR